VIIDAHAPPELPTHQTATPSDGSPPQDNRSLEWPHIDKGFAMNRTQISKSVTQPLANAFKTVAKSTTRTFAKSLRFLGRQLHLSGYKSPSPTLPNTTKTRLVPTQIFHKTHKEENTVGNPTGNELDPTKQTLAEHITQPFEQTQPSTSAPPMLHPVLKHSILLEAQKRQANIWGETIIQLAKKLNTEDYASIFSLSSALDYQTQTIPILQGKLSVDDFVLLRNMNPDPQYLTQTPEGQYEIKNCPTAIALIRDNSQLKTTPMPAQASTAHPKKQVLVGTTKKAGINVLDQKKLHQKNLNKNSTWFKRTQKIKATNMNERQIAYLPQGGINFLVAQKDVAIQNTYAGSLSITCRLSDALNMGAKIHTDISAIAGAAILVELPSGKALPVIECKKNQRPQNG
jgi:hypothetical protein